MAAAETATIAGTRRAVIRSERFVQWQRELSSARRAPYGSRKRNDDGKDGIQIYQKESEDVNETKELRGIEEEAGEDDDCCNDILKLSVKKQQQQKSPDRKKIEKEISLEHTKDGLLISSEAGLCNGQQNQVAQQVCQQQQEQEPQQQQEPASALPIKRRRRRAPKKDQELQPSRRSADGDEIAKVDLPSRNTSKRSTRLLARTLQMEEPLPPPPLKLPKLHVLLSRKEVQEDWLKMTGRRYTGKPRKSALIHLGLGLCTSLTCPSSIRYLTDP